MTRRARKTTSMAALILMAALAGPFGHGQPATNADSEPAFDDWLNERLTALVAAKLTARSPGKQTESPSATSGSTALVDRTSFADLVGAAVNLAGLSQSENGDLASSFSLTATPYSVLASIKGKDPLDPQFYSENRNWRRFALTLGREGEQGEGENRVGPATIVGGKWVIIDKRDATREEARQEISDLLTGPGVAANLAFHRIDEAVSQYLFSLRQKLGAPADQDFDAFEQQFLEAGDFNDVLKALSPQELEAIDELIGKHLPAIVELEDRFREHAQELQRRPQLSFSLISKLREDGPDEFAADAIFDYGIRKGLDFTLNAGWEYLDRQTEGDSNGGKVSAQLVFLPTSLRLEGRDPLSFTLGAEAGWMTGMKPGYQAQAKLTIPIADGINLPFSVTVANRTDLIQESDVRGQFGFTFDFARLLKP